MTSVLDILNSLEEASSPLEKEAILKQNCANITLKDAFRLTYDTNMSFDIKNIPNAGPDVNGGWCWDLYSALDSVEKWLGGHKVHGDKATDWVARILSTLTLDDQEVVKRVIGKNLGCGVSEEMAEKIWPGFKTPKSYNI